MEEDRFEREERRKILQALCSDFFDDVLMGQNGDNETQSDDQGDRIVFVLEANYSNCIANHCIFT